MNCPLSFVHCSDLACSATDATISPNGGFPFAFFQALRAAFFPTFLG